jgi:hypothetical protein
LSALLSGAGLRTRSRRFVAIIAATIGFGIAFAGAAWWRETNRSEETVAPVAQPKRSRAHSEKEKTVLKAEAGNEPTAEPKSPRVEAKPESPAPVVHATAEATPGAVKEQGAAPGPAATRPATGPALAKANADAATLRLRLARVKSAWLAERSRRSEEDTGIFDLSLDHIERRVNRGTAADLAAARRDLDGFVKSALLGEEP